MLDIKRLFDFPYHQLEAHNLEVALVSKKNGEWVNTSTKEYLDKANALSRALLKLGVQKKLFEPKTFVEFIIWIDSIGVVEKTEA